MTTGPQHLPVLLARTLELLAPAVASPGAVVVDTTLGLGGHSAALLDAFASVRVVGLDRDPRALEIAAARLAPYGDRATLVHAVYDETSPSKLQAWRLPLSAQSSPLPAGRSVRDWPGRCGGCRISCRLPGWNPPKADLLASGGRKRFRSW